MAQVCSQGRVLRSGCSVFMDEGRGMSITSECNSVGLYYMHLNGM